MSVEVRGLLDSFDHKIEFPADWEFVIIFGPNGVGKTRLLELIRSAAILDHGELLRTPFATLVLMFADGTKLEFSKLDNDVELPIRDDASDEPSVSSRPASCTVTLIRQGEEAVSHMIVAEWPDNFERWLANSTSWSRLDNLTWRDSSDGEVASTHELYRRFGSHFQPPTQAVRGRSRQANPSVKIPGPISEFVSALSIHLIETQRLLTTRRTQQRDPWDEAPPISYVQTVTQHSDDLRQQLQQAINAHSRLSQQLDRTFPRRIIQGEDAQGSEATIREIYQAQNALRARLASFSLIDAQGEVALPESQLNHFEVKALATYLSDTEKKLEVFISLLERLELFVEIMNSRLIRKWVSIDVNKGITVHRGEEGHPIPTESLSSGEQHEMVLLYDLLFRTPPNSIVLIDEPEISLHVAWQKEFLSDIVRIARLSTLRFVVATHSPQIIDEWWSRTNELTVS